MTWRVARPLKRNMFEIAQVLVGRKGREWWQQREEVAFPIPVAMVPSDRTPRRSSAERRDRHERTALAIRAPAWSPASDCPPPPPARRSAPSSATRPRRASSTATASGSWRTRCRWSSRGEGGPSSRRWRRWRSTSASRRSGRETAPGAAADPVRRGAGERPGRLDGLEDELFLEIEPNSACISRRSRWGRPRAGSGCRWPWPRRGSWSTRRGRPHVVIAAVDSLLNWPTLSVYERATRLLTATNSNGFMPGEGAGALLVGRPNGGAELLCAGLGFGVERAHIDSEEPLRADGLTAAFKQALADAGCALNELDFRITDVSGEQFYFKEAALALSRTMRQRREEFDFWHPAECIGEAGAAAGPRSSRSRTRPAEKRTPPAGHPFTWANDAGRRSAAGPPHMGGRDGQRGLRQHHGGVVQGRDGQSICAFPDVCFTPPKTPATPPGVPIPYPNTGMASDSTTVRPQ